MALKFAALQALGRALMLPIALLPVAGLLLRFGQADLLNIAAIAAAGGAIFANLPLLFAIGVAVGVARDNHGAAGLAGAVGYLILSAMLKNINPDIDSGVLGGILIGAIAGAMYNKYKDIQLPEFLAFFGGKRCVPIITGVLAVILAEVMGYIWPPIQHGLAAFSLWMANAGAVGVFLYGVCNRLLLITGFHHVLNSLFWFQLGDFRNAAGVVVHGDIARFMAGDPSAGYFMAGFFPIMMFGLPGICLAMYSSAFKENKPLVLGLLLSMALTSCLTGITEPIEYSFVFLAPWLYVIHALLTGLSLALMYCWHVRLGFAFSAGAIDYLLFFKLAQNPLYALAFGGLMFGVYYAAAVFFIKKFNLPTLGRELIDKNATLKVAERAGSSLELQYIYALGGAANLIRIDACTTRLRLLVRDSSALQPQLLKTLGAKGVLILSQDSVQVILGPAAEIMATRIREALTVSTLESLPAQTLHTGPLAVSHPENTLHAVKLTAQNILSAVGGADNLISADLVAMTRVKIKVKDETRLDSAKLTQSGVQGVVAVAANVKQLYLGEAAAALSVALQQLIQ